MSLRVEEVGDLPYGLEDADSLPGVLLRGDQEGVREAARHLFEEVVVVPRQRWSDALTMVGSADLAMSRIRRAIGLPEGATADEIAAAVEGAWGGR